VIAEGVGRQLYRCPSGGGDATLLAAFHDPRTPIESPDGKVLYVPWSLNDTTMMMLALDRPDASPQQVPEMPKISDEARRAVMPDGIYFSPQDNPRLAEGLSISPDGRYMLYSQDDESNSDIMLVNNFR
jgi:hypothetical protein